MMPVVIPRRLSKKKILFNSLTQISISEAYENMIVIITFPFNYL